MNDYETDKSRISKKLGGDWIETDEQRERRIEENRKYLQESLKQREQLLSFPLKSLVPEKGIRRRDSEGKSSVTYPSFDSSDATITYRNNGDGYKSWERMERRKDGSKGITRSDGTWDIIE